MVTYRSSSSRAMAFRQIASSAGSTSARCFEGGAGGGVVRVGDDGRAGLEGQSARQTLVQHAAQREDIGLGKNVLGVAADLLGRRDRRASRGTPRPRSLADRVHPARRPARSR